MGSLAPSRDAGVDLYWLPLGAGASPVVRWSGRLYELLVATAQRRPRRDLYHAALEVWLDGGRYAIEMGPAWQALDGSRSVVCSGPVGHRWFGRTRWFRYEVRCWRDGVIPDASEAVDSPRRLSTDRDQAREILELAAKAPPLTWGRIEHGTAEMWNSNSLIAWLLACSGHDTAAIAPPRNGRAPGWDAGLAVARATVTPAVRTGR